jgi:alpha-1,6-mannosyltransferase
MHVVDTTMFFAPESGGVKRYLLAKQRWLAAQAGMRHTLLVPGPRNAPARDGLAFVAAPPLPFSGGYRFPLRPGPWKQRLLELAPDLIEAGDPYCVPWAALGAAQALGVPALAFQHSDISRLLSSRLGGWTNRPTHSYLRALYKEFDVVIAPSRIMISKLEALGIQRTVLQPLGVDVELFHPCRRDPGLRQELGLPASTRLLVFAGRFSHEKNIPALIDAFRRLGRGHHLLLVGGSRRGRPESNVTLLPYQGRGPDLARYIASADAMVHAGDSETFGLVVAEAMACGRPVVGVDAGAIPELIDPSVGVLVPRARGDALAEGIRALFERDIEALGRQARQRVGSRYSWDQVLGNLLALYTRLIGLPDPALGEHRRAFL